MSTRSKMIQDHIIYIPGLNDHAPFHKKAAYLLCNYWKLFGKQCHLFFPNWNDDEPFQKKLRRILALIDQLHNRKHQVSLIGQSAGGSLALNAFTERKHYIHGVINITGRLSAGINVRPTLDKASLYSRAFKQSVLLFEKQNRHKLSREDRKRILTARPIWDEVVPKQTVVVEGATNIVVPFPEHVLCGGIIVTVYAPTLFRFLDSIH